MRMRLGLAAALASLALFSAPPGCAKPGTSQRLERLYAQSLAEPGDACRLRNWFSRIRR